MAKKGTENVKGKGFDKRPQNINKKGRPKKLVSGINDMLQKQGYKPVSNSEVKDAYLTMLNLPLSKIMEIAKVENDDYPTLYKLVAKELSGKRGQEMLEKLLDRSVGKPDQKIQVQQEQPLFPDKPNNNVSEDDSDK